MGGNHPHDTAEGRSSGHVGQIVRPAKNSTGGNAHCHKKNTPSRVGNPCDSHCCTPERCRCMPGRERIPSAPTGWGELEVAGMHELGAGTADGMVQNIRAALGKTMRGE